MDNLPKIIEHDGRKAVSGRELYIALGFDITHWSKWYPKNITENQFAIENQDWVPLALRANVENQSFTNPKPTKDFALSIEFAKRLAMMARTKEGEEVRDYFIRCEVDLKRVDESEDAMILRTVNILQNRLLRLETTVVVQQKALEEQYPKVEYVDTVLQSQSTITTTVIAKELGISAHRLNTLLHELGIMYRSGETWVLYSAYQDKGFTKTKTHAYTDGRGDLRTAINTVWTEEGRMFVHKKVKEHFGKRLTA